MIEQLSEEVEKRNKEIISEIVEKHFSLREDSLEKFKTLLYNREIASEFNFINKDNLRFIKEVEIANNGIDKSYNLFTSFFGMLKINYKDFSSNHITVDKNVMKIQKYIFKRLTEEPENFKTFINKFIRSDLWSPEYCNLIIGDKLYTETGEHKNPIENINFESIWGLKVSKDDPNRMLFRFRKKNVEGILINLIVDKDKMFNYINKDILRTIITKIYEKIGENKAPTRKLNLVISLNFADWFLCSTGEEWTSCLNLDSPYDCCYWKGLPGLIEDKNRCMVFLTDGTRKNFHGIETYHIVARTWALLVRTNKNPEIKLNIIRGYPNSFGFDYLVNQLGFINTVSRNELYKMVDEEENIEYPYEFDGLFMKTNNPDRFWALTIFGDDYGLKYNPETKKFQWDFCSGGAVNWFVDKNNEIDNQTTIYARYNKGVSGLIKDNKKLEEVWG